MSLIRWFLFVYVLGGLTFVPLIVALFLVYAYYTLPIAAESDTIPDHDPLSNKLGKDEKLVLKSGTDDLAESFNRKHSSDVAAGYFAVCREYVPGGVNGKPPDKLSPAGEVVATESPSVYQTMYRSIFDRSQKPTIEPNKDVNGKSVKRANNVFYVVLRHGHLMLYDDIQQLEVRYVISLEYHDVDIYGGGDELPEGELWIKRHAIRLKRKQHTTDDSATTLPFFLFSESLSEKEDFYFALLKNQEQKGDDAPSPQEFEVRDIVNLVQRLHSSEEHLQTRWLNALLGRLFLAMYKTPNMEQFFRHKLTKKISRVKKPTFITKLALQKIEPGHGAPFITNPRLKDLTVNGDCIVEADVSYTGNFRIEIAATARIDLGTRFKPRDVEMVLAATCKKIEGHALLRFKPPPSNRLWFCFEKMPKIELTLEPIVSSRQITYTLILKAIESRIREVIAESVCLPFWDDIPFFDTGTERFRGGIWKKEPVVAPSTEIRNEDPEDEAEAGSEETTIPSELSKGTDEKMMSMPVLGDTKHHMRTESKKRSVSSMKDMFGPTPPTALERSPRPEAPRILRSTSFASAAGPMISPDHADGDTPTVAGDTSPKRDSASSKLKDLSLRSVTASPAESIEGSPPTLPVRHTVVSGRSSNDGPRASVENLVLEDAKKDLTKETQAQTHLHISESPDMATGELGSSDLTEPTNNQPKKGVGFGARSMTSVDRKQTMASITAATAAAQKWGWGVVNRNKQKEAEAANAAANSQHMTSTPAMPMGRGRPLPPLGVPLPPPVKPIVKGLPFTISKRRSLPPPMLPKRSEAEESESSNATKPSPRPSPNPQLPDRRFRQSTIRHDDHQEDELLVVEAPEESNPASPVDADEHRDDFFGHAESVPETQPPIQPPIEPRIPTLPVRHEVMNPASTSDLTGESPDLH